MPLAMNPQEFCAFLKRGTLNSEIGDAGVFSTADGCFIESVDVSRTLYLHATTDISFGDCKFGIPDVKTLIRFLSSIKEDEITAVINDNRLVLSSGKSTLRYLLGDVRLIQSVSEDIITDGSDFDDVLGLPYHIILTPEDVDTFCKFNKMVKPQQVRVKMGSRGRVTLDAGRDTENKFDIVLGSAESVNDGYETIDVLLLGSVFASVLEIIEPESPATMYFNNEIVAVVQGRNLWAMQPIME